jgi:probable F420-dependent oxidoreductase
MPGSDYSPFQMPEINFGYMSRSLGHDIRSSELRTVAETAESVGFDAVSIPDHVVLPEQTEEAYPLSSSGEAPWTVSSESLGLFEVAAFIGAHTDDLTITSNVAVVPWRHPVLLAKNILTVDFLTDGRFEFGAGAGWSRVECEIFDIPFEERGHRFDEFLGLFENICEEGILESHGEFHSFDTTGFLPVPDDDIPTLIGGKSSSTFRRIGEYGDGWTSVLDSPEAVRSAKRRMENAWDDFDRSGDPEILVLHPVHIGDEPSLKTDGKRLFGDPDTVIADLQAYIDAGVTRFDILFRKPPSSDLAYPDYQVEQLERFSEEVMPSF